MRQIERKKLLEVLSRLVDGPEVPNSVCFLIYLEAFLNGQLLFSEISVSGKLLAAVLLSFTVILVWFFYSSQDPKEKTQN
jgi:hypothetical protein